MANSQENPTTKALQRLIAACDAVMRSDCGAALALAGDPKAALYEVWPEMDALQEATREARQASDASTPGARWRTNGEPDPHRSRYDCDRAQLALGYLTDDELANEVFVHDHRRGIGSMAVLTAAKDRIRWLSRLLAKLSTFVPTHRHKQRGSSYQVFTLASLQAATPCDEGAVLVIYRGEDGKAWARPHAEFHDGRFEEIAR